jgi:hypothetical protein
MRKKIIVFLAAALVMAACGRSPDRQESIRNFTRQMIELQRSASAKDAEYKQRFSALSIPDVLLPARLVTPEGRASGRATLQQFRALIAERAALRQDASARMQQLIAAMPDADLRNSVRAGVNASHNESAKWAEDMDQAQLQLADAYDAILDWCEGEGKRLKVENDRLRLSTPAQQTQLQSLLAALQAAATREHDTVARMQALQRDSRRLFDGAARQLSAPGRP